METVEVRRVRKAYEQVADQLRELIVRGSITTGQRLPNEAALSTQFGVSRATIREALRTLAAQNLIRTTKGASGGSFVILPSTDHISDFMSSNIGLLSLSDSLSLDEFLEIRELLEVPAARLAAGRRGDQGVSELRRAIPEHPLGLGIDEQFEHNRDFHSAVVEASGNRLLCIAAQPIFSVLQTHLKRSNLGNDFHEQVNADHLKIAAAIAAGDEDTAAAEMLSHLAHLQPYYERMWQSRRAAASPATDREKAAAPR